jgi:hypothetical protein
MNNASTADKGEEVVRLVASKEGALCVEEADVSFFKMMDSSQTVRNDCLKQGFEQDL